MSIKFNFSFGRTGVREHTVQGKSHAAYAFGLNSTSVMDICLCCSVKVCALCEYFYCLFQEGPRKPHA